MSIIQFNSLFPTTWVAIIAVLITCALLWLEVKRNQQFLIGRLGALLLAVLSIIGLIVNPSYSVKKTSTLTLLTPAYSQKTLDSLLLADPASQLYKLKDVTGNNQAIEIANYRSLGELKGDINVLGEGIPHYIIEYIDTAAVHFFPVDVPEGFLSFENKIYYIQQHGKIEGFYKSGRARKITLIGAGKTEDSVQVKKGINSFSLGFTPKVSGLYTYTLEALDSTGKIINKEHLPVRVEQQKKLSILILTDFPTAETRFLKNYLEKNNTRLTLRYRISKDKFRTEFVNTPQKSFGKLTETLLKGFDVVLADPSSLAILTNPEKHDLKEAMKYGLGMLTLINAETISVQLKDFLNFNLAKIKSDSARVTVNNQNLKLPATPATIISDRKIFSVLNDPSGRVVSGYFQSGLGKSGFQLLTSTYSLELSGMHDAYAELWSTLIQAVARKEQKKYDLVFTTPFPWYSNEPVEFNIIAAGERPVVSMDSIEIPLTENPLIKNVWLGKIWAGQPGWNSLNIRQDSSEHNFFISQSDAWQSLKIYNQQKALQKITSQHTQPDQHVIQQPVPQIIFFLVLLAVAGFLWLSPKL